ncbi:hypothetical protein HVA01_16020 [Halovibrio variabilis]|uniref:Flagellar protein FlaG n=1 Tax=Halovibrio variabilis TaxID=31910 RepID=A0A511UMX4_9GAMM|nr:flagellar protein FlaG [Halovibrio variabilis]GEN27956.1 hypothetical protein HVA01_16020 [Halovibrio variabilis]
MSSLPAEPATALSSLSSTLTNLSPRQRLDSTLVQLATPNNQLTNIGEKDREITQGELVEPVQRINETMRPRGLEFELSEGTSRVITRVIDRASGDVIRQIPAEEVIKIAERLEEMQGQIISLEV